MKRTRNSDFSHNRLIRLAGWAFLAVAIIAAVVAIVFLAKKDDTKLPVWEPVYPSSSNGTETSAGGSLSGDSGGRGVIIDGIQCAFTPPAELTFGVVESVDLSAIAGRVCDNARAAGWGQIVSSLSEDGSLLFYRENASVLPGDKYEEQAKFLQSSRPEDLARTFLTDSRLYDLLAGEGIRLSLDIQRDGGALLFRGSADGVQTESWVRLSFLYDGSLNQVKVYAVHLADPITTAEVLSLEKAAANAVSWSSSGSAATQVTAAEIRSVSGIPFYVLTCADGTTAYALAVKESVLDESPGARAVYDELMLTGIQEYVRVEGAGY